MKYVRLLALVLGAVLLSAPSAFALTGTVALPFAATYTAPDGTSCTHRGADVAMDGGEAVTSPVEGTVAFAGRIPGPHGGSVLAVTIATGDAKVTLLPLADLAVAKGQSIASGDELGSCAESGDPSTAGPHVHVSERHGDVYVDPAALVTAPPAPQAQPEPSIEPESAEAPQPGTAVAGGTVPVYVTPSTTAAGSSASAGAGVEGASGSTVRTGSAAHGARGASVHVGEPATTGAAAGTRVTAEPAATEIGPGVTLAPVSEAAAASVATNERIAQSSPVATATRAAAAAARPAVRFAAGHVPLAAAVLAAVVLGSASLITRRALTRRLAGEGRVSDRFGIVLQHLKTGDTLCRLTSCPGPLPSQSRGH